MKKAPLILLSVAISLAVMAQSGDEQFVNPKIDDLRHQLSTTGNDSLRARLMVQLAESFMYTNMDSNFYYAEAALQLAAQNGFIQEQIGAMGFKAQGLLNIGNLPKAMEISLKAVEMGKSLPARFGSIGPNYDNLGQIYFLIGEYDQALQYWRQELAIGQEDPMSDAFGNWNIANFYEDLNRLDSSLIYLDRSFETFGRIHYSWYPDVYPVYPHWYNTRAKVFTKQGKFDLALKDYHQSLNMSLKNNELVLSSVTCNDLSTFFDSRGQPDSSIYYAEKALEFARRSRFKKGILDAAALLSTLYEPTNPAKALQYLKIKEEQQNSLFGAGNMEAIREMMTQEEVRQRELAAAQKAYQDRLRQYALLGFLGAALLVAFLLYRNNRQKQKTNARLQAQNRELEIEAALERVRAQTMAMHKSEELREVTSILYKEIEPFGVSTFGISIAIFREEENAVEYWFADHLNSNLLQSYKVVGQKHSVFQKIWEAWRNKRPQIKIYLEGKEKWDFDTYQFEETDFRKLPEELKQDILNYKTVCLTYTFTKYGYFEAVDLTVPGEENAKILIRFANVFEQTYTRFLDLQKAEAQAREAQIEAALERVRSRTMAMQSSHELSELVEVVYRQFNSLQIANWGANIILMHPDEPSMEIWLSENDQKVYPHSFFIRGTDMLFVREQWDGWHSNKEQFTLHLFGDKKREYDDKTFAYHDFRLLPDVVKDGIRTIKEAYFTFSRMRYGFLVAINAGGKLSSEGMVVLGRFAKVFEQTYTRFLDLQRAEAQAREAKIEAGLERVRAEIASMRSPDDLQRITPLVWRELTVLEMPFFRCGVFIVDEADERVHAYLSTPEGAPLGVLHLPFDGAETTRKTVDHWRRGDVYTDFWDRQQFLDWVRSMTEQGFVRESATYQGGEEPPESLHLQFVPFTQGMLYVGSAEPLPDEQIDLLQRLADTFAVAYARYEDFTKLEEAKNRVESTLAELNATQAQLIQQEKLASLGQLTAGIAHEIKNPLNFVNNFSDLSIELIDEAFGELQTLEASPAKEEISAVLNDVKANLQKIHHHGSRADGIVRSMLLHSRESNGEMEPTDLNAFLNEYVHLAFHSMRAGKDPINVAIDLELDEQAGAVPLVVEDFSRVILNLCQNAFDAMHSKLRTNAGNDYQPRLRVRTRRAGGQIAIEVADNGPGIPEAIREKIFQPFFTTKKGTEGTGLGLSIAHDIVKAHGGALEMAAKEGEGTEFIIILPTKTNGQ